jgi:hypothetical protein
MPDPGGAGSVVHGIGQGASYRIDRDRQLVVVTYIGPISLDDIRDIQELSRRDPAFDPAFRVLFDGLRGDFSKLSADDLRRIARNTPMGPGARRAFVVNSEVNYGLVRMFGSLSENEGLGFPFALFDSMEAAIRWLNSPTD